MEWLSRNAHNGFCLRQHALALVPPCRNLRAGVLRQVVSFAFKKKKKKKELNNFFSVVDVLHLRLPKLLFLL